MDLRTRYLGLELRNPLVASASPLSETLEGMKRLEDAGVSAIVNYSLFEEEITLQSEELHRYLTTGTESYAESLTYSPEPDYLVLAPEEYFEHIRKAREALDIPVIGSLNGHTRGGWTKYAALIEEAGASALELNLYSVAADPAITGSQVEEEYLQIIREVKSQVKIPVAVKLSPYFSSMAHMAQQIVQAGADGLVLFNRFYQPDIDLERLQAYPNLVLSTPASSRLPLRWIAILYGKIQGSLAATSGIYEASDVLRMMMAGADVTMLCAALLKKGISHVGTILYDMEAWMEENEYPSLEIMKGSMSQKSSPDPKAFERANYIRALRSYRIN